MLLGVTASALIGYGAFNIWQEAQKPQPVPAQMVQIYDVALASHQNIAIGLHSGMMSIGVRIDPALTEKIGDLEASISAMPSVLSHDQEKKLRSLGEMMAATADYTSDDLKQYVDFVEGFSDSMKAERQSTLDQLKSIPGLWNAEQISNMLTVWGVYSDQFPENASNEKAMFSQVAEAALLDGTAEQREHLAKILIASSHNIKAISSGSGRIQVSKEAMADPVREILHINQDMVPVGFANAARDANAQKEIRGQIASSRDEMPPSCPPVRDPFVGGVTLDIPPAERPKIADPFAVTFDGPSYDI